LNRFLKDPQEFLMIDLLQMPQSVHPEFLFGNAAHHALRNWGLRVQEQKPLGREEFFTSFETYILEEVLATEAVRLALIRDGREALFRYFDQQLSASHPIIYRVEHTVRAHLGEIPIKGIVDRIDVDSPDSTIATIIDYKTGVPKTENEIRDGDLYRQLAFYSLLFDIGQPFLKPQAFVFEFIGSGAEHPVTRTFQISEVDRENMKKLIQEVWAKIQALDFTLQEKTPHT